MQSTPSSPSTGTYLNLRPSHSLRPAPQAVHALFVQAKTSNLPASRDKYASPKYASVSQLGCPEALPEWMFQ